MTSVKDPERKRALVLRLKRIEGQLRGVQRLIETDEDCEKIAQQLAAARKALDQTGLSISDIGALTYTGVCREHSEPATAALGSRLRRRLRPRRRIQTAARRTGLGLRHGVDQAGGKGGEFKLFSGQCRLASGRSGSDVEAGAQGQGDGRVPVVGSRLGHA